MEDRVRLKEAGEVSYLERRRLHIPLGHHVGRPLGA
ncbi:MAG: hypothetical protein RLZZ326_517, partial [Planctomycetota bacterium]